jgi:hypothetical protein
MPSRDELRRLLEAVRSACGRDLPTVTMAEVELMTPREKMSVY